MNREHIQTQETELPELYEKTVNLKSSMKDPEDPESAGGAEGVWVDTTIGPVDIQLGNTKLRLYGRDTEKGTIDGQEVPNNWLGVVVQPDNQHFDEGMGYVPIIRSDDGSFFGLDLGRGKPDAANFDFDLSVSEDHVAIVPDPELEGQFMIVDTGSKNGTAVTGWDFRNPADDATTKENEIDLAAILALDQEALIPEEEVASITPETVHGSSPEETEFLRAAVEAFKPVAGVELDSGKIFVSEPVEVAAPHEGNKYSLALHEDEDGNFSPLWFHKDTAGYGIASNGEWRLAEPVVAAADHDPFKGFKGWDNRSPHQIDASGRVVEAVEGALGYAEIVASHESTLEPIGYGELTELRRLSSDRGSVPLLDELAEVTTVVGRGVDAIETKQGFRGGNIEDIRYEINNMQLPDGFEPDFSNPPVKTYGFNHEVFGLSQIEVFEAELNGRPVVWHVASNNDHVWLYRLEFADGEPTVAGTQQEVIDGGALTLKPIEHVSFSGKWGEAGVDWNGIPDYPGYGDMKPTIDSMPWVKHYREAKKSSNLTSVDRHVIA